MASILTATPAIPAAILATSATSATTSSSHFEQSPPATSGMKLSKHQVTHNPSTTLTTPTTEDENNALSNVQPSPQYGTFDKNNHNPTKNTNEKLLFTSIDTGTGNVVFDEITNPSCCTSAVDGIYACATLPENTLQRVMTFMVIASAIIPMVLNACNETAPQTLQEDIFVALGGFMIGIVSALGLNSLQKQIVDIKQAWHDPSFSGTQKAFTSFGVLLALLTATKEGMNAFFKNLPLIANKPAALVVSTAIAIPEFLTGPLINFYAFQLAREKFTDIAALPETSRTQGMLQVCGDASIGTLALLLAIAPAYYADAMEEWFDPTPWNQWLLLNCATAHALRLGLSSPKILGSILTVQDVISHILRGSGQQIGRVLCRHKAVKSTADIEAGQPLIQKSPGTPSPIESDAKVDTDTTIPPKKRITATQVFTSLAALSLSAASMYGQYLAALQDSTLTEDLSFTNDTAAALCQDWATIDSTLSLPLQTICYILIGLLALKETKPAAKQVLGAFLPERKSPSPKGIIPKEEEI